MFGSMLLKGKKRNLVCSSEHTRHKCPSHFDPLDQNTLPTASSVDDCVIARLVGASSACAADAAAACAGVDDSACVVAAGSANGGFGDLHFLSCFIVLAFLAYGLFLPREYEETAPEQRANNGASKR